VEDLKNRLHEEKKIIKEILKETNFNVELETPYEVTIGSINHVSKLIVIILSAAIDS